MDENKRICEISVYKLTSEACSYVLTITKRFIVIKIN